MTSTHVVVETPAAYAGDGVRRGPGRSPRTRGHNVRVDPSSRPAGARSAQTVPRRAVVDDVTAARHADDPAEVAAMREERASASGCARPCATCCSRCCSWPGSCWCSSQPWNRPHAGPGDGGRPGAGRRRGARGATTGRSWRRAGCPATWRCTSARIDIAGDGERVVHARLPVARPIEVRRARSSRRPRMTDVRAASRRSTGIAGGDDHDRRRHLDALRDRGRQAPLARARRPTAYLRRHGQRRAGPRSRRSPPPSPPADRTRVR